MVQQDDTQIWVGWIMEPLNDRIQKENEFSPPYILSVHKTGKWNCKTGNGNMGLELR